jgi:hypothetical protein
LITVASGTWAIVCPVRASPNASSACRILQVSWNPATNVPAASAGRPSSKVPRMPMKPFATAKIVSARA